MGEKKLSCSFAKDIVLLKQVGINPIVVHGGGPKIKNMMNKVGVKSDFIDGLRVTNKDIAAHLKLPPVKLHCSMLAEDAIKAAIKDYEVKCECTNV